MIWPEPAIGANSPRLSLGVHCPAIVKRNIASVLFSGADGVTIEGTHADHGCHVLLHGLAAAVHEQGGTGRAALDPSADSGQLLESLRDRVLKTSSDTRVARVLAKEQRIIEADHAIYGAGSVKAYSGVQALARPRITSRGWCAAVDIAIACN